MDSNHSQDTLSSGVTTHTWRLSNPRAVVILQHGFGEYAERYVESYHRLIPRLNGMGFEVWAMDMWGHGRSPGQRSIVNIEKAVEDHIEFRRRVVSSRGGIPVFLLGHSLGGLVTAGSVVKDGDTRIDGVILTGPALPEPAPLLSRLIVNPVASFMPTWPASFGRIKVEGMCLPEEVEKFRSDPLVWKGHISFRLGATALRTAETIWPKLGQWVVPTLVMHGTNDTYTEYKQSQHLVEGIASSDKTMHLIEGGRHEALNDTGAEEHLQVILHWLENHLNDRTSSAGI